MNANIMFESRRWIRSSRRFGLLFTGPAPILRCALSLVAMDGIEHHACERVPPHAVILRSGSAVCGGVPPEVYADEEIYEKREGVYAALACEEEVEDRALLQKQDQHEQSVGRYDQARTDDNQKELASEALACRDHICGAQHFPDLPAQADGDGEIRRHACCV